jgi:CDP-paratose 2-epimerase
MKILITGICGFAGATIARAIHDLDPAIELIGIDNFSRPGSELNRLDLKRRGIAVRHADLRLASDLDGLPAVDHVIDAAANPSVLAAADGKTSSRQLLEHNLAGTVNILEFCKAAKAGFTLLSTSRVYAIEPLAQLAVKVVDQVFVPDTLQLLPEGVSANGISESFSTRPPVSLYGSSKLASEILALEYGAGCGFSVWINRCGVLAGAGQFGRGDQGIFSYWIHSYLRRQPLKYIGFGGQGWQVRDGLHPADVAPLLLQQIQHGASSSTPRIVNLAGGPRQAMSLAQLSAWCADRFGPHPVASDDTARPFDLPWMVLDCALAARAWNWQPATSLAAILEEIAVHAEKHPDWLEISAS